MEEVVNGIFAIPWFNVATGSYLNGYYIISGVLIDPPKTDNYDIMEMGRINTPKNIILTTKKHVRESEHFRDYFKAKIWMNARAAESADIKPDKTFKGGDKLPGDLVAIEIPESPNGEVLLYHKDTKSLIVGDVLIGKEMGRLEISGEGYEKAIEEILKQDFNNVLVTHGFWITGKGKGAVESARG